MEKNIHIGEDMWSDVGQSYKLSAPLIQNLRDQHILHDTSVGITQLKGRLGWKDEASLGLTEDMETKWNSFSGILCENHISLENEK